MRVLFDQSTPAPLRRAPARHEVSTAFEPGWSNLENADLLRTAQGGFEVFVTTDQNLRFQQNIAGRQLAILVLPTTNWREIRKHQDEVAAAVNSLQSGEYRDFMGERPNQPRKALTAVQTARMAASTSLRVFCMSSENRTICREAADSGFMAFTTCEGSSESGRHVEPDDGAFAGEWVLTWTPIAGRLYTLTVATNEPVGFVPLPDATDLPATVAAYTNQLAPDAPARFHRLEVRKP